MSDFGYLHEQLARQQIDERVGRRQESRVPGRRRPRGRHRLAAGLHQLADRLDA